MNNLLTWGIFNNKAIFHHFKISVHYLFFPSLVTLILTLSLVSLKLWLVKPLPWKSNLPTPLTMSNPRFKTKKVFHLTNKDWSLLVNNWKMAEPFLTTISKKNLLCIWSWDWEVVLLLLIHLWKFWLKNTTVKNLFAENVTLDCLQEPPTAERESVVTPTNWDQRRRVRTELLYVLSLSCSLSLIKFTGYAYISLMFFLLTYLSFFLIN